MKSVGIICEYNPFHNGHRYQIEVAKEMSGADCTVAVMSGNYVQRGDVAVFSKYERAKMAVAFGADIVFELPAYFSLKSAEGFARGAVSMLSAMNIDAISFGAETADISLLRKSASVIKEEKGDFKAVLKENLKKGDSYASARSKAFSAVFKEGGDVILKPNNILAIEYLAALRVLDSGAEIYPVKRVGADHDSDKAAGGFSSASNIRKLLLSGGDAAPYVPHLPKEKPIFLKDFEKLILYSLATADEKTLSSLHGGSDGMWQRIAATPQQSLDHLLLFAKTKRFALSRIKRFLINLLIGNTLPENMEPTYLRVLALNGIGATFLKEKAPSFSLPAIAKPSSIDPADNIFLLERRGSLVRGIIDGSTKDDIYMSPVFVK